MFEFGAFGLRADQAVISEVIAFEDFCRQLQVELVIVGHDDKVAAGGHAFDLVDHLFIDHFFHSGRDLRWEFVFPRVDPAHLARQAGKQRHQGTADVAGTEYGDLRLRLAHRLEQQHSGAAAALTKAGTEAEPLQAGVLTAALQHFAGQLHRLEFQMTATDGFENAVSGDHHF